MWIVQVINLIYINYFRYLLYYCHGPAFGVPYYDRLQSLDIAFRDNRIIWVVQVLSYCCINITLDSLTLSLSRLHTIHINCYASSVLYGASNMLKYPLLKILFQNVAFPHQSPSWIHGRLVFIIDITRLRYIN